jgi:hypothetical protein
MNGGVWVAGMDGWINGWMHGRKDECGRHIYGLVF